MTGGRERRLWSHAAPDAAADDALIAQLSSPPSPVAGRDSPWGFIAGLAAPFGLGLVVYLTLATGRHAQAQASPPPPVQPASVPAAAQPVQAPVTLAPPVTNIGLTAPPVTPTVGEQAARFGAPSLVVDLSDPAESGPPGPAQAASPTLGPAPVRTTAGDDRFVQRAAAQAETARATRLSNTTFLAPQGTVISAVLESALNSDVPGFVRAVVSRDITGFDGSVTLIPRGSKLIGEYKSGVAQGQSRAFVIWSRLITPEGVSINLASPAADRLGEGGLQGETNTHFFKRFGGAILLSVLDGGLQALANTTASGSNALVIGSPAQATSVASVALQKDIDVPVTVTVAQGQAIRVFVSRDLDFSDVYATGR